MNDKVGLGKDFLSKDLSDQLRNNLLALFFQKEFKVAGIGNNKKYTQDSLIRKDVIYWLDRQHNNIYENSFFDLIDQFVTYLNRTCYTGITSYEFHYAYYAEGSFYKRHLDQFKDNRSRAYSMIMYLNENWATVDGGELCIFHPTHTQIIPPQNRDIVFFRSAELEHEVLLCYKPRMSITGWFRTD